MTILAQFKTIDSKNELWLVMNFGLANLNNHDGIHNKRIINDFMSNNRTS